MKKSLIVLFSLLFAVTASAVSLKWNGNTSTSKFFGISDGQNLTGGSGSETASITVYYILYSDFSSLVEKGAIGKDEFVALNLSVATAPGNNTSANASGRVGGSTTTTAFETSGVNFFARAYATIGEKDYFMDVFGGAGSGGVWTTQQNGDIAMQETLRWENGTYGGATSTVVGTKNAWIAVNAIPEPATGALALAGVALLFKRRKA